MTRQAWVVAMAAWGVVAAVSHNAATAAPPTASASASTPSSSSSSTAAPEPAGGPAPQISDQRLREVFYDPNAVVTVPVRRGVVLQVVLGADEFITDVAAGLGADCARPDSAWCISAQPGGRNLFVKAKSTAAAPNNLAVVTDRRSHAFRFVVLADGDPQPGVYRLVVRTSSRPAPVARGSGRATAPRVAPVAVPVSPPPALQAPTQQLPPPPPAAAATPERLQPPTSAPVSTQQTPAATSATAAATAKQHMAIRLPDVSTRQLVTERLQAGPQVLNTQYSVAEGQGSQDIVPTLVFDDGRFTYLRFPGNREVPAVFQVLGDGSESLVNARMDDDLLVVDRVSRRLMLRAGRAVVGLWNDAFDLEGQPPAQGTTVPGLQRVLKAASPQPTNTRKGPTP